MRWLAVLLLAIVLHARADQISFTNWPEPRLGCPCQGGTPFTPDGTNAVRLYWDTDQDGPDLGDSIVTSWDFVPQPEGAGFFHSEWLTLQTQWVMVDSMLVWRLYEWYYIRVNRGGCCWLYADLDSIALMPGYFEVCLDSRRWQCADTTCEAVDLSVPEVVPLPSGYALRSNYPNPFNAVTTIEFEIPLASSVELSIYNLMGQSVETLLDARMSAGRHRVTWDGSRFASGVYFVRMQAGEFTGMRKIVLLR